MDGLFNYDLGFSVIPKYEKQMNKEGYLLVTNFSVEDESFYTSAAEKSGIDYVFGTKVYDVDGICYDVTGKNTKAFYVKRGTNTREFWKLYDNLKEKYLNP